MEDFYNKISHIQKVICEIEDMYLESLRVFPFNVLKKDLDEHRVEMKHVNLAERATFLTRAIQEYWDFGNNGKGEGYSYELWKDMLAYGYKMGKPPV